MKKKIIFILPFLLFLFFCKSTYSQSINIVDFLNFLDEIETIKVLTPLGNQDNSKTCYIYNLMEWTDIEIRKSVEASIYRGGLFKKTSNNKFFEKNVYIPKRTANCIVFNGSTIYIGTDEGIYKSTNSGDSWLSPENDEIDNLESSKINALLISSNIIYAGTNNGIYTSTDDGESWEQDLSQEVVFCIVSDGNDNLFLGSNKDVYKSTDNGTSWDKTNLDQQANCLRFDNSDVLYAGTSTGNNRLWKLDNGWKGVFPRLYNVKSIYFDINDNIYIGLNEFGCYLSTNGGSNWQKINNGDLYDLYLEIGTYPTIHSLEEFNNKLYAATNNGLFSSVLSSIDWNTENVRDNDYSINNVMIDRNIKNLYSENDLWIVCSGDKFWQSNYAILDGTGVFDKKYFGNYYCHTFAWHLTEGGYKYANISAPFQMKYIIDKDNPNYSDLEKNNWDYIKTTWDNENNPPDKVTYGSSHSGIIKFIPEPDGDEEDIIINSKWHNKGPLIEHKLKECPYANTSITIEYWASKKKIEVQNNELTESQCIGRELYNTSTTILSSGNDITLYVAPMQNHKIHLKSGFHAKSGSRFHAYVKDYYYDDENNDERKPCSIPWEEETTSTFTNFLAFDNESNQKSEINEQNILVFSKEPVILDTIPCKKNDWEFEFSGNGNGTAEDPYQITTIEQMQEMTYDRDGDHYWVLMNDIDASETRWWNPNIDNNGDTLRYIGFIPLEGSDIHSFDGRGYVVSDLYLQLGCLFTSLNCLTVKRVGFENIIMDSNYNSIMEPVIFRGSRDDKGFLMEECFFTVDMRSSVASVLGLVRIIRNNNNNVKNCFIDWGNITTEKDVRAFGIIWADTNGSFENCYVTGNIQGQDVRSPFGYKGIINSCFWDKDKIKVNDTTKPWMGLGLSTEDMMKRHTFESAGWDFDNVWYIDEGMDYPKLKIFKRHTEVKEAITGNDNISISPNPATDFVEITTDARTIADAVDIYDVLGVCVLSHSLAVVADGGKYKVDVSGLAAGVYFLRVGGQTLKFVKM